MSKFKEKRIHTRYDLEEELIDIMIINHSNEMSIGKIRDISKSGISFYSNFDTLKDFYKSVVDIMFVFKDKTYILETEILREENNSAYNKLHAGEFKGISSSIVSYLCELLESYKLKFSELVIN